MRILELLAFAGIASFAMPVLPIQAQLTPLEQTPQTPPPTEVNPSEPELGDRNSCRLTLADR
jgi:hypothetical protein